MAERAEAASSLRDVVGRLLGEGGVSRDRAQELLDRLVESGTLTRADADALVAGLARSGGPVQRLGGRAGDVLSTLADQLGLVRERQLDELELRVAQLEHRLRLLEQEVDEGGDA